jgi:hypothetical protein
MFRTRLGVGGWFELTCRSPAGKQKWRATIRNGVTVVGCNGILNVAFRSAAAALFSVGVIADSSYTGVSSADTHSVHPGWTEWINYAGTNRPAWIPGPSTGGIMPTLGQFSFAMNSAGSIRGAFLASNNIKGSLSPTALLYCTAVMPAGLAVANGDVISGTYILTIRE